MGNKYTEAQKRASMKYLSEKTDSIQIRTPKGTKDRWRAAAEAKGYKSMQQFIIEAVEAAIQEKPGPKMPFMVDRDTWLEFKERMDGGRVVGDPEMVKVMKTLEQFFEEKPEA